MDDKSSPVQKHDASASALASGEAQGQAGGAPLQHPCAADLPPSRRLLPPPPAVGTPYSLTSPCPSSAEAGITCGKVACTTPGTVVPLAGLCATSLAGATLTYTVNSVAATTVTCPASGSLTVNAVIANYLGTCNYTSAPVPVNGASAAGLAHAFHACMNGARACVRMRAGRARTPRP